MGDAGQPRAFAAAIDGRLRTAGAAGKSTIVGVRDGTLEIHGDAQGLIAIPAATVERMRVGFYETKAGKSFRTVIWRIGGDAPFTLQPLQPYRDPYRAIVRDFAGRVAAARGTAAVETGVATAASLVMIGLMLIPLAVALFAVLVLLPQEPEQPWWGTPAVLAFPVAILAYLIWRYLTRDRPQSISGLADLDRHLP